jgi:hypothetical protein
VGDRPHEAVREHGCPAVIREYRGCCDANLLTGLAQSYPTTNKLYLAVPSECSSMVRFRQGKTLENCAGYGVRRVRNGDCSEHAMSCGVMVFDRKGTQDGGTIARRRRRAPSRG